MRQSVAFDLSYGIRAIEMPAHNSSNSLRYVYTDEADITEDNLESVLRLSDKYVLHGLFEECVEWAKKNVNASNVCQFLPVAVLFSELGQL